MGNIIFCKNVEESIKVQNALFSVGVKWCDGTKTINKENEPFLFVEHGIISFDYKFTFIVEKILNENYLPLNSEDVIDNPMIVEGAKSPEKTITLSDGREFSESTIKAALKQYINEK